MFYKAARAQPERMVAMSNRSCFCLLSFGFLLAAFASCSFHPATHTEAAGSSASFAGVVLALESVLFDKAAGTLWYQPGCQSTGL
jgi:hypothetical protein